MAEPPEIQTLETDSHTRYTLRPVSTTGAKLPSLALFLCFKGNTLLGHATFIFSPNTDSVVWAFWKPVLEDITAKKEFTVELDGGRFVVTPLSPDGDGSMWTMALPAPSREESNIEILKKQ